MDSDNVGFRFGLELVDLRVDSGFGSGNLGFDLGLEVGPHLVDPGFQVGADCGDTASNSALASVVSSLIATSDSAM